MGRISKIVSIEEVTEKGLPSINVSDNEVAPGNSSVAGSSSKPRGAPGSSSGYPGGSSPSTAHFGSLASSGSPGESSPSTAPFGSLAPPQPKFPVKAPPEIPFKAPPRALIGLPPVKAAPRNKEAPTADVPKKAPPPSKAMPKMPSQAWIDDFAKWEKEKAQAYMFPPPPPRPVRQSPQVPTAPVEHPEPTGTKRLTTTCLFKCSKPQPAHPPSTN